MNEQEFWDEVFIAVMRSGKFASTAQNQADLAVKFRRRFMSTNDQWKDKPPRLPVVEGAFNSGGRD